MAPRTTLALLAAGAALAAGAVPAVADELTNTLVSQQRGEQFSSPALAAEMDQAIARYQQDRRDAVARDPERAPDPNPCTLVIACPIDPRLDDPGAHGLRSVGVTFTARSGATLSGHVWAAQDGPAQRPGVVIINGSIVGYEQAYWWAAQALARDGYVVLTFDSQGEGDSDQFGEAPDTGEGAGAGSPILGTDLDHGGSISGIGGSGLPFYDGGQDAVNFLLSTPSAPYVPVPSRTTQTSHAAKQRRRVAAGLNPAYNPLWDLLDRSRIGIAGHSYGAIAASWLTQADARIKAGVAWDTLCTPVAAGYDEGAAALSEPVNQAALGLFAVPGRCFGAPAAPPPITKPVLGIGADYFVPTPYPTPPDPAGKERASVAYSQAGIDSGQLMIRGGTHLEFTDLTTGLVPATRRGIDLAAWYTLAWFDRYLKDDPSAAPRLLTDRWRHDAQAAAAQPAGAPNVFSDHFRSRLDIGRGGGPRVDCEDLRVGCAALAPEAQDCGPRDFSYLAVDLGTQPPVTCARNATKKRTRVSRRRRRSRLRRPARHRRGGRRGSRARG